MILDDFVMLGTTVPEPNSDGRVFVCSAGVSEELRRLVRIYPLARRNIPHRWNIYRVPVELNPRDSRPESFKVCGDRSPESHDRINERFEHRGRLRDCERAKLLTRHVVGSIPEANERRLSLAIIHPKSMSLHFEHNPCSPNSPELRLFDIGDPQPQGAKRFPYIPRIKFQDEERDNDLMIRDWGTYELQRKRGEAYFREHLFDALHIRDDSSLLVGNLNNHRTSWLIISVLNGLRSAPTLFDALPSSREPISDAERAAVLERDGHQCIKCGSTEDLTIDHKHPHIRGGTSRNLDNLQALCMECQRRKNDKIEAR